MENCLEIKIPVKIEDGIWLEPANPIEESLGSLGALSILRVWKFPCLHWYIFQKGSLDFSSTSKNPWNQTQNGSLSLFGWSKERIPGAKGLGTCGNLGLTAYAAYLMNLQEVCFDWTKIYCKFTNGFHGMEAYHIYFDQDPKLTLIHW